MGRPRTGASDTATVERVLAAAEEEFARAGFEGARLEDIARAAGIRRPSLLYHFGSKEGLYVEVVNRAFEGLRQSLEASMSAGASFAERLDATVRSYLRFLDEHPAVGAVVLRELVDGRGPGHGILLERVVPLLETVEGFVREQGAGVVSADLPVREAILQIVMAALVRSAAGDVRQALWGPQDRTSELARQLFFGSRE